jgi:hypothetical protein
MPTTLSRLHRRGIRVATADQGEFAHAERGVLESPAPTHPVHSTAAAVRARRAWMPLVPRRTRSPAPAPPAAGHSRPRSPGRASRRPSLSRGWPRALRAALRWEWTVRHAARRRCAAGRRCCAGSGFGSTDRSHKFSRSCCRRVFRYPPPPGASANVLHNPAHSTPFTSCA